MEQFAVQNLSFTYPERTKKALADVSFEIGKGEFLCICGRSGCGKSTLLRHLKPALTPHGRRTGVISFLGERLELISDRAQAENIGFVMQNPDNQLVTDKVWHELAFGLESLGYDNQTIRLRVAEMSSYFGIEQWFHREVAELSGGQKQLLNLASVMAMGPEVLVLDEPTAQLDPIAAADFLQTVSRINRELGTTVIITEHRMEEVFPIADRVLVMEQGKVLLHDSPQNVGKALKELSHDMFLSMPTAMQIYAGVKSDAPCPLTVRDGRNWLSGISQGRPIKTDTFIPKPIPQTHDTLISMKDIWFRYSREGADVVAGVSMELRAGELFCILGGNGAGKTTNLSLIATLLTPYRGKIYIKGTEVGKIKREHLFEGCLGVLPQNPQSIFVGKTVREDLSVMLDGKKLDKAQKEATLWDIARKVEIEHLLDSHPYDLSGGEQQRAALAKVLLLSPQILLLDEPTKGMDSCFKGKFGDILAKLRAEGVGILMVSHDVEFCAMYADRCALFFGGNIVTQGRADEFFAGNSFYTTSANRMSRHLFKNAVLAKEVIELCLQNNLQQETSVS